MDSANDAARFLVQVLNWNQHVDDKLNKPIKSSTDISLEEELKNA